MSRRHITGNEASNHQMFEERLSAIGGWGNGKQGHTGIPIYSEPNRKKKLRQWRPSPSGSDLLSIQTSSGPVTRKKPVHLSTGTQESKYLERIQMTPNRKMTTLS